MKKIILGGFVEPSIFSVAFCLGGFLGYALSGSFYDRELLETVLMGIFSAFTGAYFAFSFSSWREKRRERSDNKLAITTVYFIVVRQHNAIKNMRSYMEPYETDACRHFNMPAYLSGDYSNLVVDFQSLAFLLDSKYPDLLDAIDLEAIRFKQALETEKLRADTLVSFGQPALLAAGLSPGTIRAPTLHASSVPDHVNQKCMHQTNDVYLHVYDSDASLSILREQIKAFAVEAFPGSSFAWDSANSVSSLVVNR